MGAAACEAFFILLNKKLHAPLSPMVLSSSTVAWGLALSVLLLPVSALVLAAVGLTALDGWRRECCRLPEAP